MAPTARAAARAAVLGAALLVCVQAAAAVPQWATGKQPCVGTPDRPVVHELTVQGGTFCLRMPRYLPNPERAWRGTASFPRTWKDTCGKYGITLHANAPPGAGPVTHVHFSEEEYFMPTTPGNVLRIFTQSDAKPLRIYRPGEVPAWTEPPLTDLGHVDVGYGGIGSSPIGVPHSWRTATAVQNYTIIWLAGFDMIPSINYAAVGTDANQTMGITSMWGSPSDITNGMFGGSDFPQRAAGKKSALPATTLEQLKRIQAAFDAGEACFPK